MGYKSTVKKGGIHGKDKTYDNSHVIRSIVRVCLLWVGIYGPCSIGLAGIHTDNREWNTQRLCYRHKLLAYTSLVHPRPCNGVDI